MGAHGVGLAPISLHGASGSKPVGLQPMPLKVTPDIARPINPKTFLSQLPSGWHTSETRDGRIYYWSDGGKTQWEKPTEEQVDLEKLAAAKQSEQWGSLDDDLDGDPPPPLMHAHLTKCCSCAELMNI